MGEVGADLATDVPEEPIGQRAFFELQVAEAETGMGFFALFLGVVVAFQRVKLPLVLPDGFKLADQLVRLALGEVDLAFVAGDAVNGFEDENRVWGDEGAAGFRDDVREGDVTFFADLFDVRNDVARSLPCCSSWRTHRPNGYRRSRCLSRHRRRAGPWGSPCA